MRDVRKVWMVWCPQGNHPKVHHTDRNKAVLECNRLAVLNPGKEFYLLEATEVFYTDIKPVTCQTLRHDHCRCTYTTGM